MRTGLLPLNNAVVFHRDERWVEKDQVMAFTAEIDGHRVFCTVAEEILRVHFGSERHGRFQAFRENRTQIEEVAGRRIQPGFETLKLDMRDFEDSADFIPWER